MAYPSHNPTAGDGDSRQLLAQPLRLENVFRFETAVAGEEGIAASVRARGKPVAVRGAKFCKRDQRCAVVPGLGVLPVPIERGVINNSDRAQVEARIIFNADHAPFVSRAMIALSSDSAAPGNTAGA